MQVSLESKAMFSGSQECLVALVQRRAGCFSRVAVVSHCFFDRRKVVRLVADALRDLAPSVGFYIRCEVDTNACAHARRMPGSSAKDTPGLPWNRQPGLPASN